ncbi:MAG: helix-turn-helix domain-containing protein [Tannerella sp.]|jgi:transcriptional regulator with XRE-family HTH domain|nr:helix-turn-helix domain-containing protein [Tannerella sp.]
MQANNIRKVRLQMGYSQHVMATQLGITQASYARMENQESKLTLDRLEEIAKILDTDIAALLDISPKNKQDQSNNDFANGQIENLHIENQY